MAAPRRAIFLDRDGTLLDELGYLARPEDLRLIAGVGPPLVKLREAGFFLCVVTNQSGIARGLLDEDDLAAIHERMRTELEREGAYLDAILHCPHHPKHGTPPLRRDCHCRKPSPGLILEAASRFAVDLSQSWVIGDSARDLESGRRASIEGRILVLTGKGRETEAGLSPEERAQVHVVPNLAVAAQVVLTAR